MKEITIRKEQARRGSLILVNRDHPVRGQENDLVSCPNGNSDERMNRTAAFWLSALLQGTEGSGEILAYSGWRSFEEQSRIYEEARRERGEKYAQNFVALPGRSEHQTGLAVDLAKRAEQIDWICPAFPREGICEKVRQRAYRYGFIERYPAGKEQVTQIAPEEWHFRYVGVPHAGIIRSMGLVLEEYLELLKSFSPDRPYCVPQVQETIGQSSHWKIEIFYLPVFGQEQTLLLAEDALFEISGDNCGGVVVTVWRDSDGT